MNYLEKDKLYCSQGDTSGKHEPKKIFIDAEGCYLFDERSVKYLDMQMYNSAANFGYKNEAYLIPSFARIFPVFLHITKERYKIR